jgi:hypothetical protein
MPDGHQLSSLTNERADASAPYTPPIGLILDGLDTNELEMNKTRVSVTSSFLRFLIGEMARAMPFDPDYYRHANPDVEAARLAGDVATLHEHFVLQGYFERRQPHDLPFDAAYYASNYDDLSRAFDIRDSATLRRHYDGHGWQEGRVGVSWQRTDADRWVSAARAGAADAAKPKA